MVVPVILFFLMMALPESPRWHLLKARRLERKENRLRIERHYEAWKANRLRIERHYEAAFQALRQLRTLKVQAARDMFHIDAWIAMVERPMGSRSSGAADSGKGLAHGPWKAWLRNTLELSRDDRCRRAMTAGLIVMSLQQLCGVNVLAYYSSSVFKDSLHDCNGENMCDLGENKIALKVCLTMEIEARLCSYRDSTL